MNTPTVKKSVIQAVIMIVALIVTISSCSLLNNQKTSSEPTRGEIFPRGEKVTSSNFTGTVWVSMMVQSDTTFNTQIGNVTFAPKARSNWHYHPSGQMLLITEGLGYYQEKGKSIRLIRKGDVVKCLPNVTHWHGASPNESVTHIALSPNTNKGGVVWLQKVTDEEYTSFK